MSSNSPRDRHVVTKVRRMARRAHDKIERMKQKNNAKHSVLKRPRSSLDELLWD